MPVCWLIVSFQGRITPVVLFCECFLVHCVYFQSVQVDHFTPAWFIWPAPFCPSFCRTNYPGTFLYVGRAKVEQQGRQAISNDNGNNRGPTLSSQNYLSSRKPSSDICQSALIEFPSPLLTIRNLVGDLSWLPLSRCSVHGLHFMHRSLFYNDST